MQADRPSTLCGLYLDFASIRNCVEGMKAAGIRTTDLAIVLSDGSIMSAIPTPRAPRSFEDNNTIREGVGPNYTARVSSSATALTKTLFTLGIPAYDSERLESKIKNGGILVSVRCNRLLAERVKEIFIQTGALDISCTRDAGMHCLESYPAPREQQRYTSPSIDGWRQHAAHA